MADTLTPAQKPSTGRSMLYLTLREHPLQQSDLDRWMVMREYADERGMPAVDAVMAFDAGPVGTHPVQWHTVLEAVAAGRVDAVVVWDWERGVPELRLGDGLV
jgi:hypothetical protein